MVLIEQQQIFLWRQKQNDSFSADSCEKKENISICQRHTDIYLFFVLAIRFLQLMDSKEYFLFFFPVHW